jgi:hypothetical protein
LRELLLDFIPTARRKELGYEVSQLQSVRSWNSRLQGDIDALKNQLFTGLAVEESRKAVDSSNALNRLTILAFFFLPLSLVPSVRVISRFLG